MQDTMDDNEIKTMPLSFCGEVAHNVVNKEAKDVILNRLKERYDISIQDKRAYILNNKSVYFLEKTQHIISIKSSGTNYFMFFTNLNNVNYCFFIDRKIKQGYTYPRIISVKYRFNDSIFTDTLLDCEVIKNEDNNWMTLISDMILYEGTKLECNIINRFNKIYDMLSNKYTIDRDLDISPLVVKKLFLYDKYDYLITQFIPSLSYKTKGLYFNSLNTKHANQLFLFNNNDNRNKMKQDRKPSNKVDFENDTSTNGTSTNGNVADSSSAKDDLKTFRLNKSDKPDIYNIHCKSNDTGTTHLGVACIPNIRTSKLVNKLFKESGTEFIYVKCRFNTKFNKWEPIMENKDVTNDTQISIV